MKRNKRQAFRNMIDQAKAGLIDGLDLYEWTQKAGRIGIEVRQPPAIRPYRETQKERNVRLKQEALALALTITPFPFQTFILRGRYLERIWTQSKEGYWYPTDVVRLPGTSHHVTAECIHEIIDLPDGTCWTAMLPDHKVREHRFWRFDERGFAGSRQFDKEEWVPFTNE